MADTTPTPEQVVLGLAGLLDGPDGDGVRDLLGRIAELANPSAYTALFGHPTGDGAKEQRDLALDLLDRIAPYYTARQRQEAAA